MTLHEIPTELNSRRLEIAGEVASFHPLELPRVARINSYPLNLGTMAYSELMTVYETCMDRATKANADSDTVALYMDSRFPDYPTEPLPFIA